MAFDRPTLTEIVENIQSDIVTRITGAVTLLRRSILRVLARAYAGACHLLYGNIEYNKDQLFASTADDENLRIHGNEYGINIKGATYATGTVYLTGTVDGSIAVQGTELESATGWVYTTDGDATIVGGVATTTITARDAGVDGNEDTGAVLSFVSPVVGIDSTVTVVTPGLTGGTDAEDLEDYRQRVLARKRQPPHGGAEFDYKTWMLEVAGVTRAWAISQYQGIGTVGCAFVRDDDDDLIPSETEVETVRNYIISHTDAITGKTVGLPVTAKAGLYMITLQKQTIDLTVYVYPLTSDIQSSIITAVDNVIQVVGGPGEAIYASDFSQAISAVPNESRHKVVFPSGLDYISAATNQIPVSGTITFLDYGA